MPQQTKKNKITAQMILVLIANLRDSTSGTRFSSSAMFIARTLMTMVDYARDSDSKRFEWLRESGVTSENIKQIWENKATTIPKKDRPKIKEYDAYPDKHWSYDENGRCINCFGDNKTNQASSESKAKVSDVLEEDFDEGSPPQIQIERVYNLEDLAVKLQVEFGDNDSEKYLAIKSYYLQLFGKQPDEDKSINDWKRDIIQHNLDQVKRDEELNANIQKEKDKKAEAKAKKDRIKKRASGAKRKKKRPTGTVQKTRSKKKSR